MQRAQLKFHRAEVVEVHTALDDRGPGADGFAEGAGVIEPIDANAGLKLSGILSMKQRPGAIGDDAGPQTNAPAAGPKNGAGIFDRAAAEACCAGGTQV